MAMARRRRPRAAPDLPRMARAVRDLLAATGLDPDEPELRATPERVARAWSESFLDGYAEDPAAILGKTLSAEGSAPIVIRDIAFHSLCPHHLLPFSGTAHVAYVPGKRGLGFSRVVRLVDCFAHRLTLQERIAREVAQALVTHVGMIAAACGLEAEHGCMIFHGPRRRGSRVWTESFAGDARWREPLRALLLPKKKPDR